MSCRECELQKGGKCLLGRKPKNCPCRGNVRPLKLGETKSPRGAHSPGRAARGRAVPRP